MTPVFRIISSFSPSNLYEFIDDFIFNVFSKPFLFFFSIKISGEDKTLSQLYMKVSKSQTELLNNFISYSAQATVVSIEFACLSIRFASLTSQKQTMVAPQPSQNPYRQVQQQTFQQSLNQPQQVQRTVHVQQSSNVESYIQQRPTHSQAKTTTIINGNMKKVISAAVPARR